MICGGSCSLFGDNISLNPEGSGKVPPEMRDQAALGSEARGPQNPGLWAQWWLQPNAGANQGRLSHQASWVSDRSWHLRLACQVSHG